MGLPLQPELTPWSAGQRRTMVLTVLALSVFLLGALSYARQEPPRLLGSHGRPGIEDYHTAALRLIAGAKHRVTIAIYVIRVDEDGPVDHVFRALGDAVQRGVDVRVVLDRGVDWRTGAPDTKHVEPAKQLAKLGVRVVLDEEDRTTHAKVLVVDERHVIVGSHNWTRSALAANREWSVQIDDREVARQIQAELSLLSGW